MEQSAASEKQIRYLESLLSKQTSRVLERAFATSTEVFLQTRPAMEALAAEAMRQARGDKARASQLIDAAWSIKSVIREVTGAQTDEDWVAWCSARGISL